MQYVIAGWGADEIFERCLSDEAEGSEWAKQRTQSSFNCAICRTVFFWVVCEPRRSVAKYKALSGYETTSISLDLHLSPFIQRNISNFIYSFIAWLRIHALWSLRSPLSLCVTLGVRPCILLPEVDGNSFQITWHERWTRSIRSIPFLSLAAKINHSFHLWSTCSAISHATESPRLTASFLM